MMAIIIFFVQLSYMMICKTKQKNDISLQLKNFLSKDQVRQRLRFEKIEKMRRSKYPSNKNIKIK